MKLELNNFSLQIQDQCPNYWYLIKIQSDCLTRLS
jgi:hypothetical protein